jgi:hypothetical protein
MDERRKEKSVSEFELSTEFSTGSCRSSICNKQENKQVKNNDTKVKSC